MEAHDPFFLFFTSRETRGPLTVVFESSRDQITLTKSGSVQISGVRDLLYTAMSILKICAVLTVENPSVL